MSILDEFVNDSHLGLLNDTNDETKVAQEEADMNAGDVKKHNNKIDALIANKQDEKLRNLSVKELEKLRK